MLRTSATMYQMRASCKLYRILQNTSEGLLNKKDSLGTLRSERKFLKRKYVLTERQNARAEWSKSKTINEAIT